jgi:hypothetical protein
MVAILTGVKWNLNVVLICISFKFNMHIDGEMVTAGLADPSRVCLIKGLVPRVVWWNLWGGSGTFGV